MGPLRLTHPTTLLYEIKSFAKGWVKRSASDNGLFMIYILQITI